MKRKINRNTVAIVLIFLSFIVLIPGLISPMITLSASVKILVIKKTLFNDTRSILQTIKTLFDSGNYFVSGLILFFSVLVPFIKGILLLRVLSLRNEIKRFRVYSFVRNISKWAMADVFVVGVYLAYLSAKASDNMDASLRSGFYFFAAYCLISLLALQFLKVPGTELADQPDSGKSPNRRLRTSL